MVDSKPPLPDSLDGTAHPRLTVAVAAPESAFGWWVMSRWRRTADGGVQVDIPGGGGHDYGSGILPVPGGGWLVQVGRLRPRTDNQHEFVSLRWHR